MSDIADPDDYRRTLEKLGLEQPKRTEDQEEKPEEPEVDQSDQAVEPSNNKKPTQAEILIELASGVELFHTSDHECFATFETQLSEPEDRPVISAPTQSNARRERCR